MRPTCAYPYFVLSLTFVGALTGSAQGFGGSEAECRIVIDGIERSCDEKKSADKTTSPAAPIPSQIPVQKERPKDSPTIEDRKVRPKAIARPESGWKFTEDPQSTKIVDVLAEFTIRLQERRAELEALEDRPIYKREERERVQTLRALIDREEEVVVALGDRAKGLMLACAQAKHPGWFKRYGIAKGYRMTPAGPVAAAPEVGADPAGCERSRFVDASLLTSALRYFELAHILKTRRWDYGQGDERKALENEHSRLKAELRLENTLQVRSFDGEAAEALYLRGNADELYLKNQKPRR